jgi:dihydropteroate synthase
MQFRHETVRLGPLTHRLGVRPLVMGIVNVTPDSFSDGGLFRATDHAVAHAREHVAQGADIVDIGGESTRPGAVAVSGEDELARIVPVLEGLKGSLSVPISVDTYKADVARRAAALGATIVNDVWGLQRDPAMADVVAETGASVIIMHNRESADANLDIMDDIRAFFDRSLALAARAGIADDAIVLDPGIGFGKTGPQNRIVLRRLPELLGHGLPLLIGLSRKSLLGRILDKPPEQRLAGTIAGNMIAMMGGADIIRVHDVAPHNDAARVIEAVRNAGRE